MINIKSEFWSNTLKRYFGSLIAQIIFLISEPILTRIYTPSDFAFYAQFISIVNIFIIFSTFRYELSIVLTKDTKETYNVIYLSLIILVLVSTASIFITKFYSGKIGSYFSNKLFEKYYWIIPLTILFVGIFNIFEYFFIKQEKYTFLSINKIINSLVNNLTSILIAIYFYTPIGLVVGYLVSYLYNASVYIITFLKKNYPNIIKVKTTEIKEVMLKYSDFPKINILISILDTLIFSVIIFLFSYFYRADEVGYFSRIYRLFVSPLSLLSVSITQVQYQWLSKMVNENKENKIIYSFLRKIFFFLAIISIVIIILTLLFAPYITEFYFGKGWKVAGIMGQYMIIFVVANFIASSFSSIPIVYRKQKQLLLYKVAGICILIVSIITGYLLYNNINFSLLIMSIFMFFYYVVLLNWYRKIIFQERK
ncbi:MAG: lipopolysaccharide biosynthesis protein [Bacteroidales bacterium]|nr:lipopolysaccharide biosynthesis protein [Bacteroidales bacterium]